MVGKIRQFIQNLISPESEKHRIHEQLNAPIFDEAKAMVREKIEAQNKEMDQKLNRLIKIEIKIANRKELTSEEQELTGMVQLKRNKYTIDPD